MSSMPVIDKQLIITTIYRPIFKELYKILVRIETCIHMNTLLDLVKYQTLGI